MDWMPGTPTLIGEPVPSAGRQGSILIRITCAIDADPSQELAETPELIPIRLVPETVTIVDRCPWLGPQSGVPSLLMSTLAPPPMNVPLEAVTRYSTLIVQLTGVELDSVSIVEPEVRGDHDLPPNAYEVADCSIWQVVTRRSLLIE